MDVNDLLPPDGGLRISHAAIDSDTIQLTAESAGAGSALRKRMVSR
jgi:hypothetical protein